MYAYCFISVKKKFKSHVINTWYELKGNKLILQIFLIYLNQSNNLKNYSKIHKKNLRFFVTNNINNFFLIKYLLYSPIFVCARFMVYLYRKLIILFPLIVEILRTAI